MNKGGSNYVSGGQPNNRPQGGPQQSLNLLKGSLMNLDNILAKGNERVPPS